MPADLPIGCACGALRGVARSVSGRRGSHVVCYCDDCQAFAHFLGRAGEILDDHGGTEIFQTSPARVEFTHGVEHLACMRLRPGGLMRWYASCCRSPLGNTLATRQVPFVGLILARSSGAPSRDDVLGPIRGSGFARFAKNREKLDAPDRPPLWLILRFAGLALAARLRGDHARSPFFDARTGEPRVTPRILSAEELRGVQAARDAT